MRLTLLLLVFFCYASTLSAQTKIYEQYASSVIAYSTQYNTTDYSANQITGRPNRHPDCSGNLTWAPTTSGTTREFIVVGFATPQKVNTVRVYQTKGPGAVDTVYIRNAATSAWQTIYVATAAAKTCSSALLEIKIPTTAYNVDAVRIAVNSPAVADFQEFDAISIAAFDYTTFQWQQYASSLLTFSTQYSATSWSAQQAIGPPDSSPCNDDSRAWCPSTADGRREFLELGYAYPAKVNRVRVFQQYNVGAVDTIYLREAATGTWHKIYDTTGNTKPCPSQKIIEVNFTRTTYNVDAVRIALNSPLATSWNEIDAIELVTDLPGNAKLSVQSGNWSSTSTWSGGVIPTATDTVIIGKGHNITVDGIFSIKSLFINESATLALNNAANSLTLGPNGGGRELFQVQGTLAITNGSLNVNGSADFQQGSTFSMSGGNFVVDGNNGSEAGSVLEDFPLFNLRSTMAAVAFTGGTVTIVDPPYNAGGQAITGNYTFGVNSILKIGNGVSTTGGNNPNGFGGTGQFPGLGSLVVDAVTNAGNRHFSILDDVTMLGNVTVQSGELRPKFAFVVNGNVLNNGTITNEGTFRTLGNLTNNAAINVTGSFSVVGDFINNATGVYKVTGTHYTSVGGNLVNNGSFTSNWLYMANNFGVSTNEQTLGGTGTFNIFGLEPINSHPNGVTLQVPLTVQHIYFESQPGKLFIGNNDLRVQQFAYGSPNSNAYVVINGTGKLIVESIATTEKLFPVGTTSYTPITIDNGSNHTFSVWVRTGLANPAFNTSIVNREWTITDITGGAVNATLIFQWNAADENTGFNRNLCYAGRYTGSAWQARSPYAAAAGTNPYTRTVTNITGFSPFAIASDGAFGGPLPLDLVSFTARKCSNNACLEWVTENEVDVSHYEVQRSKDAVSFESITSVQALNQAQARYTATDNSIKKGIVYYRLKNVDKDGKTTYSRIAKIDFGKDYTVFISPNPVKEKVYIQGAENFRKINILDVNGRLVRELKPTTNNTYDISFLQQGMYWVQLSGEQGTETHKLLKE